jgi:hypothetical protein
LERSVDGAPLYLNHGEVSLHLVQSGKTHGSRAMNARPRLASARASLSFGSVPRIPNHGPQITRLRRLEEFKVNAECIERRTSRDKPHSM